MFRPALKTIVVVLAGAVVPASAPAVAGATSNLTFVVNTTSDAHDANPGDGICADSSGQCTLRAAVEESNAQPAGTDVSVTVPAGTYTLTLGALTASANTLKLTGAGPTKTVIDANRGSGAMSVAKQVHLALIDLALIRGARTKAGGGLSNAGITRFMHVTVKYNAAASGAGISNSSGAALHLVDSTVSLNSARSGADSQPGGSAGGILNAGRLTLLNSTVTGNSAGNGGLGLSDTGGNGGNGGGIVNTGTITATSSTISNNYAGSGGLGNQELPGSGGSGGGIYSSAGSITLTSSSVTGNVAGYAGADETGDGAANAGDGGGIWSAGALTVTQGTFTGNSGATGGTGTSGGAIFTSGAATISQSYFGANTAGVGYLGRSGNGGAIANTGTLTLTDSTLTANGAGAGAAQSGEMGGNGGGLYTSAGTATLTGDTISANTSGNGGSAPFVDPGGAFGGPGGDGAGIYSTATLTVTNSTVSANQTGTGGANSPPHVGSAPPGVGGGLATGGGQSTLSHVTLADNSDGIENLAGGVTLDGTIVADNTAQNCAGAIGESFGFNLDSGTSCNFSLATDITATEPQLGALAMNGGSTETQALLSGSPAIDHGGTGTSGCPATDQRGMTRPDEASDGGACDVGAYESQVGT